MISEKRLVIPLFLSFSQVEPSKKTTKNDQLIFIYVTNDIKKNKLKKSFNVDVHNLDMNDLYAKIKLF